jgi:hypothetical protein
MEDPGGSVIRHHICFHPIHQTIIQLPRIAWSSVNRFHQEDWYIWLAFKQYTYLEGDLFVMSINIDTRSGLVKNRPCRVIQIKNRRVVFPFEDGETRALTRVPMEKTSNGMKCIRYQLPLWLIFAGTVHRSQVMTFQRAIIDYRTKFWEHGQLYVALSQIKSPIDLCILLPDDMNDFTIPPPVGLDVVQILETMESSRGLLNPKFRLVIVSNQVLVPSTHLTQLSQKNSLAPMTTSTLPRIRLIMVPVSIMVLVKYLIRTPMRFPSMFRSCHGSLRTNKCFDLIVLEISYLKAIYPYLLCLLRRFSVGYFKPAAQNSCQ